MFFGAAPREYIKILSDVEEVCIRLQNMKLRYKVERAVAVVGALACVCGETLVKLKKLSHPKVSGDPKDFTQWRRKFNQLVLSGGPFVKIGKYLREAIPKKYRQCIQHLDTTNHEKLMNIQEKIVRTKTLVVNDIINQIRKFKMVT